MVNGKSAIRIRLAIVLSLATATVLFAEDGIGNGTRAFAPRRVFTPDSLRHKLGGGLEMMLDEKLAAASERASVQDADGAMVVVYMLSVPSGANLKVLEKLGVTIYPETWTPPVGKHPWGFVLAKLPLLKHVDVLALPFIKRMASAERILQPQNNAAYKVIKADLVWEKGSDGSGVKIAILDSGLDTDPVNADLPASFEKEDYSSGGRTDPIDRNVENTKSGHGTHVTGTVLGRGVRSADNVGNGGGAYKGMAPGADLVFLKIGDDVTGGATEKAILAAMTAAVTTYNADIISMSYGGWGRFNDGSEEMEQKVDWCFEQGTAVFLSAGNAADDKRHYSGTVAAGSQSGFIRVNVAGIDPRTLYFNTVWRDGSSTSNALSLHYYNSGGGEISDVTQPASTESNRGTESRYSKYNIDVSPGIYYLRVWNESSSPVNFHIYEYLASGYVTFQSPDPAYTVGSPAVADHAIAVTAYSSRNDWVDYSGSPQGWAMTEDDICYFSSRGPRIDGIQKPEIAAPGAAIISMRDTDYLTLPDYRWVDNDGVVGGNADYYANLGTSMACPVVAGAAALLLQKTPTLTPQQLYDAITGNAATDAYTGACPNATWGYGKLDVNAAYPPEVFVDAEVMLEGAYSTSTHAMQTTLRDEGRVPSVPPYAEDNDRSVTVPTGIADWVLVELRATAGGPVIASKSALLRADGRIVSDNGAFTRIPISAPAGDYYVVVKHRNHTAVMSKNTIGLSVSSSTPYSFADNSSYSFGLNPVKLLEAGVYGMWAGDINQDSQVTTMDYTAWYNSARLGESGYRDTDVNMNGQVTTEDYTMWYNDARLGAASGLP